MPEHKITYLLIDTSYLRKVGFNDPGFRKLIRHSEEGNAKIFVPHIVWEERRTQLLEAASKHTRRLMDAYEKYKADVGTDFVFGGLPIPALSIPTDQGKD